MTDFAGVAAKIARAETQIEALDADLGAFCTKIKGLIVHETNSEAGEQAWVYRGATPNAPIEWSVSVGEVLYNLRSALDHLVWQLVLGNGQKPGRNNEFPVVNSHDDWQDATRWKLTGVGDDVKEQIRRLQPYTGGINLPFDVSAFWTLQSLCNIDKHRHPIFCIAVTSGIGPVVFGENQPPRRISASRHPLKGTAILGKINPGSVLLRLNDPEQGLKPEFQIEVRFDYQQRPELVAGTVSEILRGCLRAVRGADSLLR